MAKKKSKPAPVKVPLLWNVSVTHRDYLATMNNFGRKLRMTTSSLWIVSPQPEGTDPDIDLALSRTRQFIRGNQRRYKLACINSIEHRGSIDV